MSKRKATTVASQFVVKHKYVTPTPPPPFPPKLLNVSTPISRYVNYAHASILANETPMTMTLDSELGMPLDLTEIEGLYVGDLSGFNVDPKNAPPLDAEDIALLVDAAGNASSLSTGKGIKSKAEVTWLRRTEYISSEASKNTRTEGIESRFAYSARHGKDSANHNTREGQLAAIEASFETIAKSKDISKLKHPADSTLTAVESFDVYPDFNTWSNTYSLFQFQTDPMEHALRQKQEPVPSEGSSNGPLREPELRPEYAIFRPIAPTGPGDAGFVTYFTPDTDGAKAWKRRKIDHEVQEGGEEEERISFKHIRDYDNQITKIDPPLSELVFVLGNAHDESQTGAYYSDLAARVILRKRRAKRGGRIRLPNYVSSIDLATRSMRPEELDRVQKSIKALEEGVTDDAVEEQQPVAPAEDDDADAHEDREMDDDDE